MSNNDDTDKILSDIELILPNEIVEACRTLKPNGISYFMSVNDEAGTNSHISLHKLDDESVKIRVTVTAFGLRQNEKNEDIARDDVRKCTEYVGARQVTSTDGVALNTLEGKVATETDVDGLSDEGVRSEVGRERFGRRKFCVVSPLDGNRLKRRLTATSWLAKRKKMFKKRRPRVVSCAGAASLILRVVAVARENDRKKSDEEDDGDGKKETTDESTKCERESGSSTVIIIRTVARQPSTNEESKFDASRATPNDDETRSRGDDRRTSYDADEKDAGKAAPPAPPPSATSRDIAERLKARPRKGVQQLTCDLCGETEDDYLGLYRHVRIRHGDCTFVRNYLDELEPLASTPCPYCERLFLTASGLKTHVNTAHPDETAQTARQISKLGLQRTHLAAASQSSSAEKRRKELSEPSAPSFGPFVCKVCRKPFMDVVKYRRHVQIAHVATRFQCDNCEKGFRVKENLNRHVEKVHAQKFQRHPGTGGGGGGSRTAVEQTKAATVTSSPSSGKASSSSVVSSSKGPGSEFRCDHCDISFNRMSLLVTHLRYCLKSKSSGVNSGGGSGITAKKY